MNTREFNKLLEMNETKKNQFMKVYDITMNYTSDTGCTITQECYPNETLIRIIIEGVKSKFTITFNPITMELGRKPRNVKPYFTKEETGYMSDILQNRM